MNKFMYKPIYLVLLLLFVLSACTQPPTQTLNAQDFGTSGYDYGAAVSALPTGVGAVAVGYTLGSLDGINKGGPDAFIRKYDGGVVWAQQFGTRSYDSAGSVALHSSGVSNVLGDTDGALGFKVGQRDAFLRKYSSSGSVIWTRQFGTPTEDYSWDMVLAGNFIYTLTIEPSTKFTIRKWNASGSLLMTIQETSSAFVEVSALVVDSLENIYVLTTYNTGSKYIARMYSYNSAGTFLAAKTIFNPVGNAVLYDLIIDSSNNLYMSVIDNALGRGAYLRKLSTAGTTIWTRYLEPPSTTNSVSPQGLALDSSGNVYVTGYIYNASYPGFTFKGYNDTFTLKYSPAGTRLWVTQIGGNSNDYANGVAVSDAVYVIGNSLSNPNLLGDPGYGNEDAFLIQLDKSTGALLGIDQ